MNGQHQIYKKSAALQASLIPYNAEARKNGAFYLEVATATDPQNKVYDWTNKIKFALGVEDITKILDVAMGEPTELKLIHVPGGNNATDKTKSKSLTMTPGVGNFAGTWMWKFNDNTGAKPVNVNIGVSRAEFHLIVRLMADCVPAILGFDFTGLGRQLQYVTQKLG